MKTKYECFYLIYSDRFECENESLLNTNLDATSLTCTIDER